MKRIVQLWSICLAPALIPSGCAPVGMTPSNENANDNTALNDNANSNDNTGPPFGVEIQVPNEGAMHIPVGTPAAYVSNPPASGPHWSQAGVAPAPPGVYTDALAEEQWVHNLEHGYVVILYDCAGECDPSLLTDFEDLYDNLPASEVFGTVKLVVTPYDGLPGLIMAVAWDVQWNGESFDEDALSTFYESYLDQGPELAP